MAITTPFPILTFNERILAPTFGYVFDKHWLDPHESIVSMLWKFARQNALPGHLLASQATPDFVDPYEGVEVYRETVNFNRLRQALCLPLKTLRLSVLPRSRRGIASSYLRFCQRCLTRSYHSLIHQLEPVQHCPVHGSWLEVECRHCAHATPYMLNARLLDAPFRCSNCRQYLAGCPLSRSQFTPLPMKHRIPLMRARLRHRCT